MMIEGGAWEKKDFECPVYDTNLPLIVRVPSLDQMELFNYL